MTVARNALGCSTFVGLACWAAIATAQEAAKPKEAEAAKEPAWTELSVTSQAVPEQRLRHRLFPDDAERLPGNAVPILLRLPMEQGRTYWDRIKGSERLLKMSAAEFSALPDVRKEVPIPAIHLDALRRAAFRTEADWQYPLHEQRLDQVLLPDMQLRWILRALAVHCRADIQEGKFADAIDKITIGMGVADHFGQTPFGVCKIVQWSIADTMLDRVEELVQAPASPNLYWALAMLPDPFIDLRPTIDWERRMWSSAAPEIKDLGQLRGEKDWAQVLDKIIEAMRERDAEVYEATKGLDGVRAFRQKSVVAARAELGKIDAKLADKVAGMSDSEVSVRFFATLASLKVDEGMVTMALPPPLALPRLERVARQIKDCSHGLPVLNSAFTMQGLYATAWSLQRQIAALQVVEALRDYAARHGGKLPERLADVVETPIVLDPLTGRPFGYRLAEGAAEITAGAIQVGGERRYGIRWRVRLRPRAASANLTLQDSQNGKSAKN